MAKILTQGLTLNWQRWAIVLLGGCMASLAAAASFDPSAYGAYATDNQAHLFDVASSDMSLAFLRMIFGQVGTVLVGGSSRLMADLFAIFNLGMLVFAGFLVTYTVIMSVVSSSQDGTPAGQKISVWVAFRVVLGTSLLVPLSGYSGAQVLVMWSVIQGVGLADQVWNKAVVYIAQSGGSMITPANLKQYDDLRTLLGASYSGPPMSGKKAYFSDLYSSSLCLRALSQVAQSKSQSNASAARAVDQSTQGGVPLPPVAQSISGSQSSDDYRVRYGLACGGNQSNVVCFGHKSAPKACGSYTWSANAGQPTSQTTVSRSTAIELSLKRAIYALDSGVSDWFAHAEKQGYKSDGTFDASKLNCSVTQTEDVAYRRCGPASTLISAATEYYLSLRPMMIMQAGDNQQDVKAPWRVSAMRQGWIMAGQHYSDLVNKGGDTRPTMDKLSNYQLTVDQGISEKALNSLTGKPKEIVRAVTQPSGLLENNFLIAAQEVINRLSDSSGVDNGRSQSVDSQYLTDLDVVASTLMKLLVYSPLNASSGAFSAKSHVGGVHLNVAADNLMVMVRQVLGVMAGIRVFNTDDVGALYATRPNQHMLLNQSPCQKASVKAACSSDNPASCFVDAVSLGLKGADATCMRNALRNDGDSRSQARTACFPDPVNQPHACIRVGEGILGSIAAWRSGSSAIVDPLKNLRDLGITMIDNAIAYWTDTLNAIYRTLQGLVKDYTLAMMGVSVAGSVLSGLLGMMSEGLAQIGVVLANGGNAVLKLFYQFDMQSMMLYLPFGAMVAMVFFVMGTTLGIYTPFIPFLLYLFACIGWLIAVIEAMVAAPLVALGVTHPEGHDLLGKAEQSLILLLGVFVRPVTILIGFLLAILLNRVALGMLNYGFVHVLVNYLDPGFGGGATSASVGLGSTMNNALVKTVGVSAVLIVYTFTVVSVVNMCFSMIYVVPEKLLRWIGGPQDQSMVAQAMQEVKGGVRDSAGQVGQGASSKVGQGVQGSPGEMPTSNMGKLGQDLKKPKGAEASTDGPGGGESTPSGGGEDGGSGGAPSGGAAEGSAAEGGASGGGAAEGSGVGRPSAADDGE